MRILVCSVTPVQVCGLCSVGSNGTFQPFPSEKPCLTATVCKAGEQDDAYMTIFSDRTCKPCTLSLEYQPNLDQRKCLKTKVCKFDDFQEWMPTPPTVLSNRECKATQLCGDIGAQYETVAPGIDNDRECTAPSSPNMSYFLTHFRFHEGSFSHQVSYSIQIR